MGEHLNSRGALKHEKGSFLSDISTPQQIAYTTDEISENPYLILIETTQRYYKLLLEVEIKLDEEKEQRKQITSQFERFLVEMLEVLDFWEGVLGFAENIKSSVDNDIKNLIDSFQQGVKLLQKKLFGIGVKPCEPKTGEPFIPGKHYCIGTESCEELPEGVICKLVKKGYTWNGRLLRPPYVTTVENQKEV